MTDHAHTDLFAGAERELIERAQDAPANDRAAILTFVAQMRRSENARLRIESEGLIIEDSKGYPIPHPAIDIERAASRELRGWIDRRPDLFGSPTSTASTTGRGGAKHDDAKPAGGLSDELAAIRAARTSSA